ncbi:11703_t:CDS:1 [Ambispora gerdemannii]|uniref:11703_t:CDS:1 n=1 Tax=Ambispora gerdemannii TaxID=144530 RepID=A0A9N9H6H2_9GLOM|nr:11703_t:CDS:1 [Ambispora gerdemannii]
MDERSQLPGIRPDLPSLKELIALLNLPNSGIDVDAWRAYFVACWIKARKLNYHYENSLIRRMAQDSWQQEPENVKLLYVGLADEAMNVPSTSNVANQGSTSSDPSDEEQQSTFANTLGDFDYFNGNAAEVLFKNQSGI